MARSSSDKHSLKARRGTIVVRKTPKTNNTDNRRQSFPENHYASDRAEETLMMLLAEPEIQLLMHADRVNVQSLIAELNSISAQLRSNAPPAISTESRSSKSSSRLLPNDAEYRPGVGIMLLNRQGQVFIAQRVDVKGEAWQMPQGGINEDESPRRAALRELREEIGTNNVDIIAESKEWFYYDVPPDVARNAWGGKWRGQRQKWFVMIFKGKDSDINLATEHPEFNAWRWTSLDKLSSFAVAFKRELYSHVIGEFATIFRD